MEIRKLDNSNIEYNDISINCLDDSLEISDQIFLLNNILVTKNQSLNFIRILISKLFSEQTLVENKEKIILLPYLIELHSLNMLKSFDQHLLAMIEQFSQDLSIQNDNLFNLIKFLNAIHQVETKFNTQLSLDLELIHIQLESQNIVKNMIKDDDQYLDIFKNYKIQNFTQDIIENLNNEFSSSSSSESSSESSDQDHIFPINLDDINLHEKFSDNKLRFIINLLIQNYANEKNINFEDIQLNLNKINANIQSENIIISSYSNQITQLSKHDDNLNKQLSKQFKIPTSLDESMIQEIVDLKEMDEQTEQEIDVIATPDVYILDEEPVVQEALVDELVPRTSVRDINKPLIPMFDSKDGMVEDPQRYDFNK